MFSQSYFCTRKALLVNRIAEHKNRLTRIAIAEVRNKQHDKQSTQEALAFIVQLFTLVYSTKENPDSYKDRDN